MLKHERLDKLTRILTEKPTWTALELAETLQTSVRTVLRDLDALREQAIPVESEQGRGGGIRLSSNWGTRKFQLSNHEVLSLLLSISVFEKLNTPLFSADFKKLRGRMLQGLNDEQKKRVRELRERVFIGSLAGTQIPALSTKLDLHIFKGLEGPFLDCYKIKIQYKDQKNKLSQRIVEPHALVLNWPIWYLLGFDELRRAPRTFRLDRIQKIKALDSRFKPTPDTLMSYLLPELKGEHL